MWLIIALIALVFSVLTWKNNTELQEANDCLAEENCDLREEIILNKHSECLVAQYQRVLGLLTNGQLQALEKKAIKNEVTTGLVRNPTDEDPSGYVVLLD